MHCIIWANTTTAVHESKKWLPPVHETVPGAIYPSKPGAPDMLSCLPSNRCEFSCLERCPPKGTWKNAKNSTSSEQTGSSPGWDKP